MIFKVKKHNTDDVYEMMCEFWDLHKFPKISRKILPKNTFVVYVNDVPAYTTSFYFTDSESLAWLGWQISNPKLKYKDKKGALTHLMNYICEYAKSNNIKMILTTSSTESAITSLKESGFQEGDMNVNHYIKTL